mmetsp:Transcript_7373/g.27788  ORF Transcript_7373/g.27788 Transcript_7373/m.27788 type:complete len:300 (-) Transcript_7373:64-963(-)
MENSSNKPISAGTPAVCHAFGFSRPALRVSLTRPKISSSQSSASKLTSPAPAPTDAEVADLNVPLAGSGPFLARFPRYSCVETNKLSNPSLVPGSVEDTREAPHQGVAASAHFTRKSPLGCHAKALPPFCADFATSAASLAQHKSESSVSITTEAFRTNTEGNMVMYRTSSFARSWSSVVELASRSSRRSNNESTKSPTNFCEPLVFSRPTNATYTGVFTGSSSTHSRMNSVACWVKLGRSAARSPAKLPVISGDPSRCTIAFLISRSSRSIPGTGGGRNPPPLPRPPPRCWEPSPPCR